MNTGMRDACNLAWKLALVCHGLCKEELLLDSYGSNHVASLVLGLAPVRKMAANVATELLIGYPKSPLTVHGSLEQKEPTAGERAPAHEGDQPIGGGSIPKFVLFADDDEDTRELIQRYTPHS
jgi:FAD binding domain